MALGRSGLWQVLLQSHLQLSQSTMFMPSILLMRILALSSQLGLSFLLLEDTSIPSNDYSTGKTANVYKTILPRAASL